MKNINHFKWIILLTTFTFLIISCGAPLRYQDLSSNAKYEILQFPLLTTPKAYREIIWSKDKQVTAFIYDGYAYIDNQPYVIEGDPTIRYLGLEQDETCTLKTHYFFSTLLPDGRLGLKKYCVTGTHNPLSVGPTKSYLVAYDWQTGKLEQIVKTPLPNAERSGCSSWNPDMTRAIDGTNDGLSGGLYWLTSSGSEPLNLTLHDGLRSWNLAKNYDVTDSIVNEGIATCASWSPNGKEIAFFATLKPIGLDGFARSDKPYDLCLYPISTGKAANVLSGIYSPYNVQWSPDNKLIAFLGRISNNDQEEAALWVFDPKTNQLSLMATGFFEHFVWSPNSDKIVIIWCPNLLCSNSRNTEIRKYSIDLPH